MTVYVFILRLFSSQNQRQEKRYQESDYEVENSSDEDRNVNMSCQDSHDDCCRRRCKTEVEEYHLDYDRKGLSLVLRER